MKLQEFLKKAQALVDAKSCTHVYGADLTTFAEMFDLYGNYDEEFYTRMQKHFITYWTCTDSLVGMSVYTLDGKIVAISIQIGRKCDERIEFVSHDAQELVFETVLSYATRDIPCKVNELDISDDWFIPDDVVGSVCEIQVLGAQNEI